MSRGSMAKERMQELVELCESGLITQDEFNAKRKAILDKARKRNPGVVFFDERLARGKNACSAAPSASSPWRRRTPSTARR